MYYSWKRGSESEKEREWKRCSERKSNETRRWCDVVALATAAVDIVFFWRCCCCNCHFSLSQKNRNNFFCCCRARQLSLFNISIKMCDCYFIQTASETWPIILDFIIVRQCDRAARMGKNLFSSHVQSERNKRNFDTQQQKL